jgi:hypothetical protein
MKWFVLRRRRPRRRRAWSARVGAIGERAWRLIANGSEQIKWDVSLAGIVIMTRYELVLSGHFRPNSKHWLRNFVSTKPSRCIVLLRLPDL